MIKGRVNKNLEAICQNCGCSRKDCLDLFDLKLPNGKITMCDECVNELFYKCLSCVCYTDHRIKSPRDIRLINSRKSLASKLQKEDRR